MKRLIFLVMSVFIFGCATTNYSPSYTSSYSSSSSYQNYKDFDYYFDKAYYSNEPNIQIEYYTKAIEKWSYLNGKENLAIAYYNRGNKYHEKGEWDLAINDYSKAIEINPEYAEAYNNRGWVYIDKSQYTSAIEDFEKALSIKNYSDALLGLSIVYMRLKDISKSKEYFNKAIELEPLLKNGMEGIEELEKKGYWYSENHKKELTKLFNKFLNKQKTQR